MTDHQTVSVEAAKLVKEWSVWMVAVQSALIGFLVAGVPSDKMGGWMAAALACFGMSVLAAAWMLSALPYIVLQVAHIPELNIYMMPLSTAPLLRSVRMWYMGAVQHWTFGVGIVFLIVARLLP